MKLLYFAPILLLAGCMTDRQIMDRDCSHQIMIRDAANAALIVARRIKDPALREAAIDKVNSDLDRLDRCPPVGSPVPTSPVTH